MLSGVLMRGEPKLKVVFLANPRNSIKSFLFFIFAMSIAVAASPHRPLPIAVVIAVRRKHEPNPIRGREDQSFSTGADGADFSAGADARVVQSGTQWHKMAQSGTE
jgi:hypothetical protein